MGVPSARATSSPQFFIGWVVVLAWFPLWWWRKSRDRARGAPEPATGSRHRRHRVAGETRRLLPDAEPCNDGLVAGAHRSSQMNPFGRQRGALEAPKPAPAAVLLAAPGLEFSDEAIAAAVAAAGGGVIRVLSTAKIFGTALGIQHPGLLPSKREVKIQEDIVADAVERIKSAGGRAKGEIVASTRLVGRPSCVLPERYSVRSVVLVPTQGNRLRRLLEGNPAATLRRRLGDEVEVQELERT